MTVRSTRPMRILALTNLYPPHSYGGYESMCSLVVQRWRDRGHCVTVLTSAAEVPGATSVEGEVGVNRRLRMYWEDHTVLRPGLAARYAIERENQRHLAAILSAPPPEVISVWNMGGLSMGLLTKLERKVAPLVLVLADDWLVYGPELDAWTRQFARRPRLARLVRRVTGLETVAPDLSVETSRLAFASDYTRQRALAWSRWRREDASVIPWGVSGDQFGQQPIRAWSGELLYVGRIDSRKGITTLFRALALLPDYALTVVGGGDSSHERELRLLALNLGVAERIYWAGPVGPAEVASYYAKADVCVFPSEWEEPFGLVALEAMACGRPLVATATGGSREFLADEHNCLLFLPGSAHQLADRVRRLAANPLLRATLVKGGEATAARLSFERFADALEEVHASTAASRN